MDTSKVSSLFRYLRENMEKKVSDYLDYESLQLRKWQIIETIGALHSDVIKWQSRQLVAGSATP